MKHLLLFVAPCFLLGLFQVSCGQASSQTPPPGPGQPGNARLDSLGAVSWLASAGNKFYLNNSNEFYVYVKLKGNEGIINNKRVPLNISIVLDRSGSMAGDKIAYA